MSNKNFVVASSSHSKRLGQPSRQVTMPMHRPTHHDVFPGQFVEEHMLLERPEDDEEAPVAETQGSSLVFPAPWRLCAFALKQKHRLCKWASVGYLSAMSTVAEIKTAFKQLPEREQWKLAEWIQETLASFETLDADGARGREPVSAVVSIVRKVKRERREACRRS